MSMNSPFQIFWASFGGTSTPPGETAGGAADGWGAGGAAGLTPMRPRGCHWRPGSGCWWGGYWLGGWWSYQITPGES